MRARIRARRGYAATARLPIRISLVCDLCAKDSRMFSGSRRLCLSAARSSLRGSAAHRYGGSGNSYDGEKEGLRPDTKPRAGSRGVALFAPANPKPLECTRRPVKRWTARQRGRSSPRPSGVTPAALAWRRDAQEVGSLGLPVS